MNNLRAVLDKIHNQRDMVKRGTGDPARDDILRDEGRNPMIEYCHIRTIFGTLTFEQTIEEFKKTNK